MRYGPVMSLVDTAAILAGASLVTIAGLHVYWGLGGHWPGTDEPSLTATVVGPTPDGRMPGLGACSVVAALLLAAAALLALARGWVSVDAGQPPWIATAGTLGAAAVLLARGVGGLFERRLRPAIVGLPYDRLNRRVYSPLCLVLAGALFASALLP